MGHSAEFESKNPIEASMYTCVCNGINETTIKQYVHEGAKTIEDIRKKCKIADSCGLCLPAIKRLLRETNASSVS